MLRRLLLSAAGSTRVRRLVATALVSRSVVSRFVAGERTDDAVRVAGELARAGLAVSLDHLGEDTTAVDQAKSNTTAYLTLLSRLHDAGLAGAAEVSVKLSAVGQAVDPAMALDNARAICDAAGRAGTTVTIDMEDHTTTDATLQVVKELRVDWPWTGAVIQSYLYRSTADCVALAYPGSRVRLCKGAYREPPSVAFAARHDVDLSYVRCLRALMSGDAYAMVATHDARLIRIAGALAERHGRVPGSFEYQMLYGVRPDEQARLVGTGATVRVYVPYGDEWYGYLMRRMAERPANTAFFLRALVTRS